MAITKKRSRATRSASAKTRSGNKTRTHRARSSKQHSVVPRTKIARRQEKDEITYVFECTRPGCGYRIWRDDMSEKGQVRHDLKCPKCHNKEFRCLGQGDLPDTFQIPVPTATLDFDSIKPVDLGSK